MRPFDHAWTLLKQENQLVYPKWLSNYDAMTECANCGKPTNVLHGLRTTHDPDEEVWCKHCLGPNNF